jgi:hypothetical protein
VANEQDTTDGTEEQEKAKRERNAEKQRRYRERQRSSETPDKRAEKLANRRVYGKVYRERTAEANREHVRDYAKAYRQRKKDAGYDPLPRTDAKIERQREISKAWYLANKELVRAREATRRLTQSESSKEMERARVARKMEARSKRIAAETPELAEARRTANRDRARKRALENPNHIAKRGAVDIQFRIACRLRQRLSYALRNCNGKKCAKTTEMLGCSITEFIQYIVGRFTRGMTLEKWHSGDIHIDHIRPVASFDLTDPIQQKTCFHYTNLQPLWQIDNMRKGARLDWAMAA